MKGNTMAEVTKEDMNRIYDKLEPIAEDVTTIKIRLNDHLKAHERWSGPVLRAVFDVVKMGVVATVAFIIARK